MYCQALKYLYAAIRTIHDVLASHRIMATYTYILYISLRAGCTYILTHILLLVSDTPQNHISTRRRCQKVAPGAPAQAVYLLLSRCLEIVEQAALHSPDLVTMPQFISSSIIADDAHLHIGLVTDVYHAVGNTARHEEYG